jgi:transposase
MSTDPQNLPRDPDILIGMVIEMREEIERLQGQLATFKAMIFGAKSEKLSLILAEQLPLDLGDLVTDLSPVAANDDVASEGVAVSKPPRKAAARNIGFLPKHLPRIETIIEPVSLNCACCTGRMHKIGEDVAEVLDCVPAILRVNRIIRPKYACRACEDGVSQALCPDRLIEGGMASNALIVNVAVWKFAWYMPLSRQVKMLQGQGINLDRSTLCRWMKRLVWWVEPLYRRQIDVMHTYPRLFCDETRMPVRRKDKRGTTHTGQFWTHATDDSPWRGPAPAAVAHIYADTRKGEIIEAQLADYQGLVQVDAYPGYNGLTAPDRKPGPIRLAYCLAHARREFTDVYKKTPSVFIEEVLKVLSEIYAIEKEIRGTDADNRRRVRQERSAALIVALKAKLELGLSQISKKSTLAGAINYSLNRWEGLTLFLSDGRLEVDNNTVERSIRGIAQGRRGSLFAGDDGGAHTWAVLGSLLTTAKLNGLDPFTYLNDVVDCIVSGRVKASNLDCLLAWNWRTTHGAQAELKVAA